jgi:hypothetical protein
MSRNYQRSCPYCNHQNARSEGIFDYDISQCQDCGACWKTEHLNHLLKTKGTDEKAWKKMEDEAAILMPHPIKTDGKVERKNKESD